MMEAAAQYWRQRARDYDRAREPGAWVEHYWNSWRAPYRLALAEALARVLPHDHSTVLEVGCHVGPNLRLWRDRWARLRLMGFDVSPEAVAAAKAHFAGDPGVHVWEEDLLDGFTLPVADVIVSCYALAYVPPHFVVPVARRLREAARVALVLAEPLVLGGAAAGLCEYEVEEYRHDWAGAFEDLGALVNVKPIPVVDRLNGILTAEWRAP